MLMFVCTRVQALYRDMLERSEALKLPPLFPIAMAVMARNRLNCSSATRIASLYAWGLAACCLMPAWS